MSEAVCGLGLAASGPPYPALRCGAPRGDPCPAFVLTLGHSWSRVPPALREMYAGDERGVVPYPRTGERIEWVPIINANFTQRSKVAIPIDIAAAGRCRSQRLCVPDEPPPALVPASYPPFLSS